MKLYCKEMTRTYVQATTGLSANAPCHNLAAAHSAASNATTLACASDYNSDTSLELKPCRMCTHLDEVGRLRLVLRIPLPVGGDVGEDGEQDERKLRGTGLSLFLPSPIQSNFRQTASPPTAT